MAGPTDWIDAALARWVSFTLRFRKSIVALTIVAGAGALLYAAQNLGINTDTADMISPELPWRQDFIRYRESFPVRDRNLIVVIDGATADASDEFASRLAAALRARPDVYHSAFLGGDGEFFARNGLLYLPLESLEALADRLIAAQPLLGLLGQRFNGAGLIDVIARTFEQGADEPGAEALEPLYAELARTIEGAAAGTPRAVGWRRLLLGEAPGTRRLILLAPALDFDSVQPGRAAIDGVHAAIAELGGTPPGVTVRLTGTVAMEHEELRTLAEGASLASGASLVLVAALLFATLRSWRLLAISVAMLLVGLSFTAAFAAATVGHLNLLSVAFAVLYIGLGVDYLTHVNLRIKELRAQGLHPDDAIRAGTSEIGASLLVCAVTTSVGFFAFIPTSFAGVSELGLISGTGIFVSFLVAVSLLPAFVGTFLARRAPVAAEPWVNARVFEPLIRRPRAVVAVSVAATLAALAALPYVEFDSNPINLRDPDTESVRTLRELAAESDAPLLQLAAIAPDHATALDWEAALERLDGVSEVVTVASLVPDEQAEKLAVLEDLAFVLGPRIAAAPRLPPDAAALETELRALEQQLAAAAGAGAALRDAIAAFLARLPGLEAAESRARLAALDRDLIGDLPRELERLATALDAQPFGAEDLPSELRERWIAPDGSELIEIVPSEDVSQNAAAARFVEAVRTVVPNATGLPVVYEEASSTILGAFRTAFVTAAVVVTLILWLTLRSVKDAALVVGPILLACVLTAGVTVLLDMPFNYANIITLPLLVAIGVDSGIHLIHRMRVGGERAERLFRTSTSHAVLASTLTSVASFGNLGLSRHVGTASMGIFLTVGMGAVIATTLIFLPALLKLRDPA